MHDTTKLRAGRSLRRLAVEHDLGFCNGGDYCGCGEDAQEVEPDQANLICSDVPYSDGKIHRPVIDLDFECHLVPSATEGHFHLYLDKPVTYEQYRKILLVLREAGIVQSGWVRSFERRGYSAVRDPNHPKKEGEK